MWEVAELERIPTKKEMSEAQNQRYGVAVGETFSKSRIAVCGLGGLGSNIAVSLARAGVGSLILIDFDRVDVSNLHRQQYKASQIGLRKTEALASNLLEIAPYAAITTHDVRITKTNLPLLLGSADIICEAFDKAEEKAMLVNGVLEHFPEKYIIAASGMAGFGPANLIQTRKITSHFYLCGDGVSDAYKDTGLIASRVMLCAAHQAHMALSLLAGWETL